MTGKELDLKYFKNVLKEERERLQNQINQIRKERPSIGRQGSQGEPLSYDDDSGDTASDVSEAEKLSALEKSVYELLSKVEAALLKIRKKTYGICESCGKPIDKARLEVIPYATLCVKCKAKEEK